MKIIVMSTGKKSSKSFIIQVVDGERVVHAEQVKGVKERDALVWSLADLYSAVDIELQEEKEEFKFTEIPTIPVLEEEEADEFFEDNQALVYARILQAVEEGVRADRESIRLFELNGTGVYITSLKSNWKSGVDQALKYYISTEEYDKCIVARQLMLKL